MFQISDTHIQWWHTKHWTSQSNSCAAVPSCGKSQTNQHQLNSAIISALKLINYTVACGVGLR